MKIIHRRRHTGKTTELIELASKEGGYIVCHSREEAYRISIIARDIGKSILFPLTYDEYLTGQFVGRNVKGFYIDNIDFLLSRLSKGVPVKAITINSEEGNL